MRIPTSSFIILVSGVVFLRPLLVSLTVIKTAGALPGAREGLPLGSRPPACGSLRRPARREDWRTVGVTVDSPRAPGLPAPQAPPEHSVLPPRPPRPRALPNPCQAPAAPAQGADLLPPPAPGAFWGSSAVRSPGLRGLPSRTWASRFPHLPRCRAWWAARETPGTPGGGREPVRGRGSGRQWPWVPEAAAGLRAGRLLATEPGGTEQRFQAPHHSFLPEDLTSSRGRFRTVRPTESLHGDWFRTSVRIPGRGRDGDFGNTRISRMDKLRLELG